MSVSSFDCGVGIGGIFLLVTSMVDPIRLRVSEGGGTLVSASASEVRGAKRPRAEAEAISLLLCNFLFLDERLNVLKGMLKGTSTKGGDGYNES